MVRLHMPRWIVVAALLAVGCHPAKSPELRVLGTSPELIYVQVSNPASHAMKLTKLEYKFAAAGATVSQGELELSTEVPAGETSVVEVPLEGSPTTPVTLTGTLTAELDEIVRSFSLSAQIQPH